MGRGKVSEYSNYQFTAGEFLNHFLLGFQFYLTDVFLDYKFRSYGWESAVYYTHPYKLRQNKEGGIRWRINNQYVFRQQ